MSNLIARAGPKYYKCFMLDARKEAVDEIERLNDLVALQKKDMKIAMDRLAKLEADNDSLRNTIISMQLSLKSDGERIAKLESIIKSLYIETSDNWVQQYIKEQGEALE